MYSVYRGVLYSESVTQFHGTQINVISRHPMRTVRPSLCADCHALQHYATPHIPTFPMHGVILPPSRTVWLSLCRSSLLFLCGSTCTETNGLVADTTLQTDGLTGRHIRLARMCLWVQACHAIKLQCWRNNKRDALYICEDSCNIRHRWTGTHSRHFVRSLLWNGEHQPDAQNVLELEDGLSRNLKIATKTRNVTDRQCHLHRATVWSVPNCSSAGIDRRGPQDLGMSV